MSKNGGVGDAEHPDGAGGILFPNSNGTKRLYINLKSDLSYFMWVSKTEKLKCEQYQPYIHSHSVLETHHK